MIFSIPPHEAPRDDALQVPRRYLDVAIQVLRQPVSKVLRKNGRP